MGDICPPWDNVNKLSFDYLPITPEGPVWFLQDRWQLSIVLKRNK